MFKDLLSEVVKLMIKFCEKTGRVMTITGTGEDTDVYLIRYYFIRSSLFNVFVHIFLRSDRDDMHDHPWDFMTWILRGSYVEHLAIDGWVDNAKQTVRSPTSNNFITRKATDIHKVMLYKNYTVLERDQAPMTLCITGPTKREWGFVKFTPHEPYCSSNVGCNEINHGSQKWVPWRKYLGLPEDTPGRG